MNIQFNCVKSLKQRWQKSKKILNNWPSLNETFMPIPESDTTSKRSTTLGFLMIHTRSRSYCHQITAISHRDSWKCPSGFSRFDYAPYAGWIHGQIVWIKVIKNMYRYGSCWQFLFLWSTYSYISFIFILIIPFT